MPLKTGRSGLPTRRERESRGVRDRDGDSFADPVETQGLPSCRRRHVVVGEGVRGDIYRHCHLSVVPPSRAIHGRAVSARTFLCLAGDSPVGAPASPAREDGATSAPHSCFT